LQDIIGKLLVKVVQVKEKRTIRTRFGPRETQSIFVKDCEGLKSTVSLWNSHIDSLENGKVYIFSGMTTEHFPTKKPHYISTTKTTTIEEAPLVLAEPFSDIQLVDGTDGGYIVCFQNIYVYESCLRCKCRIKDASLARCVKCNSELTDKYQDFIFVLIIEVNDEFKSFTGFKRVLNVDVVNVVDDQIEMELNDIYVGRLVTITYMKRYAETGEDCIIDTFEMA
jgi:hypothetical protein